MRNNKWEVISRIIMPPSFLEDKDVIFVSFYEILRFFFDSRTLKRQKGSKIYKINEQPRKTCIQYV